jgi:hypothetical protein
MRKQDADGSNDEEHRGNEKKRAVAQVRVIEDTRDHEND